MALKVRYARIAAGFDRIGKMGGKATRIGL